MYNKSKGHSASGTNALAPPSLDNTWFKWIKYLNPRANDLHNRQIRGAKKTIKESKKPL